MLAPWKISYDQPRQHIKKQRHCFTNKGPSSQSYGSSSSRVWMWELDYKAEHRRTDALEPWCWRRLLRVPWTARRSILKEISPEYSLEGLTLKLKFWSFNTLANWCKELIIWKDPICETAKETQMYTKNRILDSVGEVECGMIWENSIETCILPYMK